MGYLKSMKGNYNEDIEVKHEEIEKGEKILPF